MSEGEKKSNNLTYLNTASVGLVSRVSVEAAQRFQEATLTNPSKAFMEWMHNGLVYLREKMASLICTQPSQIALIPNFSYGLVSVINNMNGHVKNVLLYKDDYPSLNLPFELGGFHVHYVESQDGFAVSLSQIEEIIRKEKIEVVALSHVQFLTGFAINLDELADICKRNEVVLIVDATQGLSAFDFNFDASSVDVLISSSYKWLNGGVGSAVMAIKDSFMNRFIPRSAGFGSMEHSENGWSYNPSLLSYEPGHLNAIGLLQLEAAVEQRLKAGVHEVAQHDHALVKRLAEGMADTSFRVCGGYKTDHLISILCFEAEQKVHDYLLQSGIATTWRKGLIRVSPHFYNTEADIDKLLYVLKEFDKD